MPKGFKIESESNLQKQEDLKNKVIHRKHHRTGTNSQNIPHEQNSPKKTRKKTENNINSTMNSIISENNTSNNKENEGVNLSNNNQLLNKKSMRIHKPKIKEDLGYIDKNVIQGKSNPLRVSISKKCEKALFLIKKLGNFDYLYSKNSNSINSDTPSIAKIEKNIKNYKYQSSYEFINDLRRLWGFYYKNLTSLPLYEQRIGNLIRNSEQILNNLELFNAEKSEMIEINKKIDNLERELSNIKRNKSYNINNYNNINNNYNLSLKRAVSGEKSFSFAEKSTIKTNINKLTLEQKKGIVNVLGDVLNTTNKKIVEFDIEKLGNKKLRELEKYVMDCLQKNMEKKAQNINNLIQLKNEQTSSIINSSHNQSEIDTNKKLDIENDNFSNTSDDDESESSSLSSLK
jgi:hypothetical protein